MQSIRVFWFKGVYRTARFIASPAMGRILHYTYDIVTPKHTPYMVFSNHTTPWDHLMIGMAIKGHMYYVAGEHLFRKKSRRFFGALLLDPIIRKKGAPAGDMIRDIKERLGAGHNVWMSPEGVRSINGETAFISPGTGKLVKECEDLGASLITYRMHGGYLRRPRWGKTPRDGKMRGEFVHEYLPAELKSMTVDQINKAIDRDLYVNTFDDQKKDQQPYTGMDLAEYLETILYICPECKQMGKLHSKGDIFSCECGYAVKFNVFGLFEPASSHPLHHYNSVSWDHWQRDLIKENLPTYLATSKDVSIESDEGQILGKIGAMKSVEELGTGRFSIYVDRMEFEGDKGKFVFPFADIEGFAFSLQMKILFSLHDGTYYEVESKIPRSAAKYMVLYRFLIGKEYK